MSTRPHLVKRSSKLATLATLLVLTIGATLFGTASPASASSMSTVFNVHTFSGPTPYCLAMHATLPMGWYETFGYLNNGAHAEVSLWGDDTWYDNLIDRSPVVYYGGIDYSNGRTEITTALNNNGIDVWRNKCFSGSQLNEDIGEDDIYMKVTVWDGDGRVLAQAKTRVIHQYF